MKHLSDLKPFYIDQSNIMRLKEISVCMFYTGVYAATGDPCLPGSGLGCSEWFGSRHSSQSVCISIINYRFSDLSVCLSVYQLPVDARLSLSLYVYLTRMCACLVVCLSVCPSALYFDCLLPVIANRNCTSLFLSAASFLFT